MTARNLTDDSKIGRLDRVAMWLSAACVVHCLATAILVAVLSTAGGILGSPVIHETGLVLAIALGCVAFGRGIVAHRRVLPILLGATGLSLMMAALVVAHAGGHLVESALTIVGVAVLAAGHAVNRHAHR
ncbi:MerC domain-containing protein [Sphingomonas phyllosphaerae]|uniref:MerC domain-containing protein n=1 Tax=Sphingomonas phyllosphaerae TaxID=257003 RepID=UPI00040E480D|nr:MerC domain-containing protein [Sphingomonas phyllosphaerae]